MFATHPLIFFFFLSGGRKICQRDIPVRIGLEMGKVVELLTPAQVRAETLRCISL